MTAALTAAPAASTCPRCGASFACGAHAAAPCACAAFTLTDACRAELRAAWTGCLCGACLAALAAPSGEAA